MATTPRAGAESGMMIRQYIWNQLAPSSRAASSISRGIVIMYWRSRKMLKGWPKKDWMTSGQRVLTQPIWVKSRYNGTSVTWSGSIIVHRTSRKRKPRNRKRKRAKAKATSELEKTVAMMLTTETIVEFLKKV